MIRRVILAVLVLSLPTCGESPATREADGSFDTDALSRLTLEEELRIGSLDDPDYGFSRVGMVDVDAEGRVYVAETLDLEIRVYSPSGELLRRIGGPGEGPGEFQSGITRFGVTGDTVWAVDTRFESGWLLLFRLTGEPLSKRRIERVTTDPDANGRCDLISPRMRAADGHFLGEPSMGLICSASPSGPSALSAGPPPVPRVRFDDQGQVVDTAGWYERGPSGPMDVIDVGSSQYLLPRPPYVGPARILLADGRIQVDRFPAESSERGTFRITRLGLLSDTVYSRTYAYRPVRYPERVLEAAAARAARSGGLVLLTPDGEVKMLERTAGDSSNAYRVLRDRMPYPEFQPPVQGDHLGSDGRLWLHREETDEDSVRWTILDADGLPVGELDTPRTGFRIGWSSGDTLWAVETGEFDVPWLVRYRIR